VQRLGNPGLTEDRRFRLISRVIDSLAALGRTGLFVGAVLGLGAYTRDVLVAFAGKETAANLVLSLIVNLQADRWVAYLVGAFGVGYGAVERHVRRRNIKRLTTHTEELEKRLHPARASSGLTPKGKTRREDR
jgi:hypothetical protein